MKVRLQLTLDALDTFRQFVIQVYHYYYQRNDFTSFICRNRLRALVLRLTKKCNRLINAPVDKVQPIKVSAGEFWALDNALKEMVWLDLKPGIQAVVGEIFRQLTQQMMLGYGQVSELPDTAVSFNWHRQSAG